MENTAIPGKGKAIASLVLGILSLIFLCLSGKSALFPLIGLVLSIIGLALAGSAKKDGYTGGMRTAGFVLSLITLILCVISMIAVIAMVGAVFSLF